MQILIVLIICMLNLFKVQSLNYFHNEWVVEIHGGPNVAQLIAAELGYDYQGQV